ncbi:MAG: hypothetical protein D6690_17380 [Nitrospirae bacterium]|nr:MAG: hypothetical protein D6690_17380 [Nitrospirota bacterium]
MNIRALSSSLSDFFNATHSSDVAARFQRDAKLPERAFSTFDARTRTMAGVTIVTAEGDTVTLSSDTAIRVRGMTYNARGFAERQAVRFQGQAIETQMTHRQF